MTTALVRLGDVFTRAFSLTLATLREIFDESAYARFLTRQQTHSSPEAYAAFLREQASSHRSRPRCC
jgi:hypothetical protein